MKANVPVRSRQDLERFAQAYLAHRVRWFEENSLQHRSIGLLIALSGSVTMIAGALLMNRVALYTGSPIMLGTMLVMLALHVVVFLYSVISRPLPIFHRFVGFVISGGYGGLTPSVYTTGGVLARGGRMYLRSKRMTPHDRESFDLLSAEWIGSTNDLIRAVKVL